MRTMKVKLTLQEAILGTSPANPEIYSDFIGSKAPNAATLEEEVERLGTEAITEKGTTIFPKDDDGKPFLYDYQLKGFFKDACSMLARVGGKATVNESSKLKAYKKVIDGMIFPKPREIRIDTDEDIRICERPLRAMTMQGERVSLARSEEIPAGATIAFDIVMLDESLDPAVREWLDYGELRGLGQWRNSGKGRFTWEEVQE